MHTSILDRLSSPLCEAVLETPDVATDEIGRSVSTLSYLEHSNLFLIPLDDEGIWYRYHHLFSDLLYARLQQLLSADQIIKLHTRAADWYERNRFIYEAIYHVSLTSNNTWVEHRAYLQ